MRALLLVGLGGFIGSSLRYALGGWIQRLSGNPWFPYGTFGVNALGCFLIGLLGGWSDNAGFFSPAVRLFLFIGLLGGFTTFSTFGYETLALMRDRQMAAAFLNGGLHLFFGLGAVWAGYGISSWR